MSADELDVLDVKMSALRELCSICTICLDGMENNTNLFFCIGCRNKFHQACIIRMLNYNISIRQYFHFCPLCRNQIIVDAPILPVNRALQRITLDMETTPLIANPRDGVNGIFIDARTLARPEYPQMSGAIIRLVDNPAYYREHPRRRCNHFFCRLIFCCCVNKCIYR